MTAYGLKTTVNLPYEAAIARVTEALKGEGFGILTEIDVKATFKKKLDVDFKRYVILGACNPNLAYQGLQAEADLGLLLPCNVIVYEVDENSSVVAILDPNLMVTASGNPALESLGQEARARLERVVQSL
ncbi:MAG: DUF302 domain-containing protein [Chloroflexi bacterium]|nr:MAG: DUF302 domain-containing protein [Chloroflexota bacterium]